MTDDLPDYLVLSGQIEAAGLVYGLAEIHGIACGLLCAMAEDFPILWQDTVFADADPNDLLVSEARDALDQLVDYSAAQLNASELALSLMLPADDEPTRLRVAAVRDWSQGFLYGFGIAGEQAGRLFSRDAAEALKDLAEISRLDTEQLLDGGNDEEALTELTEYLWVAALSIRQDMQSGKRRPRHEFG